VWGMTPAVRFYTIGRFAFQLPCHDRIMYHTLYLKCVYGLLYAAHTDLYTGPRAHQGHLALPCEPVLANLACPNMIRRASSAV
jgi:hypothetical protein